MNPRTFGSITVITTIFLGLVHAVIGTDVSLFDFLWQDLVAVLFVVILARETGAIQSEESKPVSLVINNKFDEILNNQWADQDTNGLDKYAIQNISNVFEKLAEKIASLETSLESKQIAYASAVAVPANVEPENVVHSADINARKTVKLINNDISKPAVPKAKQVMLKKILNENLNMQKKAS